MLIITGALLYDLIPHIIQLSIVSKLFPVPHPCMNLQHYALYASNQNNLLYSSTLEIYSSVELQMQLSY